MENQFYSGAHGNYSRFVFAQMTLEQQANNSTIKVAGIPAGVEIHKAKMKFGNVVNEGGTTLDLGLRQVDPNSGFEVPPVGSWPDDSDILFDGADPVDNALRENEFIPPIIVDQHNVELFLTVRTALAANASVPLTIALEFIARGTS